MLVIQKTLVNPKSLPAPRGFNHGIVVTGGRLLFLAGQDASGPDGKIVAPGDVVAQYAQVLANLRAVVEDAGSAMQDIVKLNVFVRNRADYVSKLRQIGEAHRRAFGNYYPAMALFEVSGFFQQDALIEMEGMAVLDSESAAP